MRFMQYLFALFQGAYKSGKPGKPGNLREFCNSGKLRENSGNLKCTLEIFGAHYYQRQKCRPMTLVSESIRFMLIMQIFAGVPLGGGVKRHSTLCKKYAKMTATVVLYIGFSLYNCLEKTTQTVWKTWKTQGISFCQICKHPELVRPQC